MAQNESQTPVQGRRFVVLISGRGSNLRAIVQKVRAQVSHAKFVAVISNEPDALGLVWAQNEGLETDVIAHRDFADRASFDRALAQRIDAYQPDYVILAGFMRILTEEFVLHYAGRLINIHPSLLPSFPGLHTHQRALETGVGWHGCTVHFVTPEVDHGPIIAQAALDVREDDTPETLAQRVQVLEHEIYPQVVMWLAQSKVNLDSQGKVTVSGVQDRHLRLVSEVTELVSY